MKKILSLIFIGILSIFISSCGNEKNVSSPIEIVSSQDVNKIPNPNLILLDQNGNEHKLSDYNGKKILINFMGTFCPPCVKELPDINKLYHETGENKKDIIVLSVIFPHSKYNRDMRERDENGIKDFINEHNIEYPVLFDTRGTLLKDFGIYSYPTTFTINKSNNIYGYHIGALEYNQMLEILNQTKN